MKCSCHLAIPTLLRRLLLVVVVIVSCTLKVLHAASADDPSGGATEPGSSAGVATGVPPFNPIEVSSCNLCYLNGGSASNVNEPIAPGSSTTCGDVNTILNSSLYYDTACYLIQATDLPAQCGCPTVAPTPAPVSYPVCKVCQNAGELITNPYEFLDFSGTPALADLANQTSTYYITQCYAIDYYGRYNYIDSTVCQLLQDADISNRCGCTLFSLGSSTCAGATTLELAADKPLFVTIPNTTASFNSTKYQNKPCILDSPSAWFKVTGTGGPLTVDTCSEFYNFNIKISVFSGTSCADQLTCSGGNNNYNCRYSFDSQSGKTYYVAIGGFYGDIGSFQVFLTDKTTVSPSSYPTAITPAPVAPAVAPFVPTDAPVPTPSPSPYPTATVFPECNICGNSNQRISLPDVKLSSSSYYSCRDLEYSGLTGQITPPICNVLKELGYDTKCGCTTPSGNDVCSGATTISEGQSLFGNTVGSTWDNSQICPYDNFYSPGVWFKTIGTGGLIKFDTCTSPSDDFYGQLSLYVGNDCNSLQCLATNSGFCGSGGRVTVQSVQGATYYVLVHGYSTGNFTLSYSTVVPPVNDQCANAIPISPGQTINASTTDATPDLTAPTTCGDDRNNTFTKGVWYRVAGSVAGGGTRRYIANTCGSGTTYDTAVSVLKGSCGNLVCVDGNDNFCRRGSRVVWESDGTEDHFVLVHGTDYTTDYSTEFELQLTAEEATPTVSPAPSSRAFYFGGCNCFGSKDCFCAFDTNPQKKTGTEGGGGFSPPPASPQAPRPGSAGGGDGGGSSNPPPYAAPVAQASVPTLPPVAPTSTTTTKGKGRKNRPSYSTPPSSTSNTAPTAPTGGKASKAGRTNNNKQGKGASRTSSPTTTGASSVERSGGKGKKNKTRRV